MPAARALAALQQAFEELVRLLGVVAADLVVEVGHRDPQDAARPQHAVQLAQRRLGLARGEVLEHVRAERRLERAVGIRQRAREVEVVHPPEGAVAVRRPALVGEPPGAPQRACQPGHAGDRQVRRDVGVQPAVVGDVEGADVELGGLRLAAPAGEAHRRRSVPSTRCAPTTRTSGPTHRRTPSRGRGSGGGRCCWRPWRPATACSTSAAARGASSPRCATRGSSRWASRSPRRRSTAPPATRPAPSCGCSRPTARSRSSTRASMSCGARRCSSTCPTPPTCCSRSAACCAPAAACSSPSPSTAA